MKYTLRQLKAMARESLRGKYGIVISAFLLYTCITFFINSLSGILFRDSSTLTYIISWIFSFIISLIMCIFAAGMDYIYLNISRGKETHVSDLLYMFNHNPDRAIVAGFVITILSTISSLPVNLLLNFSTDEMWEDPVSLSAMMLGTLLLSLVLNIILCLPFTFTYFLLTDSQEMEAKEALKTSIRLTKKNLGRLITLQISFLGLILLSVFTLYLALLWVIPYMKTSVAMLYRDAMGELPQPSIPYGQSYGSQRPVYPKPPYRPEQPYEEPGSNAAREKDDFNSEA